MKKRSFTALLLSIVLMMSLAAPAWAAGTVSGPVYVVDNEGFPMTCRAFAVHLKQDGLDFVEILRDGNAVSDSEYVETGMVIHVLDEFGNVTGTRSVAVLGDVTGTGMAGIQQVTRMAKALTGEPLQGLFLIAGDINGSGTMNIADLVLAARQAAAVGSSGSCTRTEESYPLYVLAAEPGGTENLSFFNGITDIPYVSVEDWIPLIESFYGNAFTYSDHGSGVIMITNAEGYWAEVNCTGGSVSFLDFDAFFKKPYASTILDVTQQTPVLERPAGSYDLYGRPVVLPLRSYGIDLIYQDGACYMPLQTFCDIFLESNNMSFRFNGQGLFLSAGSTGLGGAEDAYYVAPTGNRSEALAQFSYQELCLALDMYYGLQEQHDITQFSLLCEQTGLQDRLLSTDPEEAAVALNDLLYGIFDDGHSGYEANSYLLGREVSVRPTYFGSAMTSSIATLLRFREAREKYFPDGAVPYQEVGNTAYVTFDSFSMDITSDYAEIDPSAIGSDTVQLIMYAHEQIMRKDSPIENVVVDLSNNGGGMVDAGIAVVAWYLGGSAVLNINSALTGAQASTKYSFDVNRDGVFDENDSVSGKRLFCITSPQSFSCGNLVPSCFRASDEVTLMGMDSGGGACIVDFLTMADGTALRISGPKRLSSLSNGSFYDIDKGVPVDIPITVLDHFYDREQLTAFVNGVFR